MNINIMIRKGADCVISYAPLWQTMQRQGITTYTLIHKHNFSPATIHQLRHDRSVTMYTLERLCKILDCQADGIVLFLPDPE